MSKDLGRTVQHFGTWYMWSMSERGNLSLVSVERVNDQLRQINETLKARPISAD